jgi:hypothetical protein
MSVDAQPTKEPAEKRQDVYDCQQSSLAQGITNPTPHVGMADCCDAQGLPAVQAGGDVIVPVDELIVALGIKTEDEE